MTFLALTIGKSVSGVKSMTPQTRSVFAYMRQYEDPACNVGTITCCLPLQRNIDSLPDP